MNGLKQHVSDYDHTFVTKQISATTVYITMHDLKMNIADFHMKYTSLKK